MPYKKNRLSMVIFMPEKAECFLKMEKSFSNFDFASLQSCYKLTLLLLVPKFSLSTTHMLVEPLHKIGISKNFEEEETDFSKLTNETGLEVSDIIQKVLLR